MFGMSLTEILIILAIALVVLGPEKLPQLARQMGKLMRQVRRAAFDLKSAVDFDEPPRKRKVSSASSKGPYAQAAQDDQKEFGVTHPRQTPLDTSSDDASSPTDENDGPIDPYEKRLEELAREGDLHAALLASAGAGGEGALTENIEVVSLKPWVSLTDIGVTHDRSPILRPPLELLGGVVSVEVSGGAAPLIAAAATNAARAEDDALSSGEADSADSSKDVNEASDDTRGTATESADGGQDAHEASDEADDTNAVAESPEPAVQGA